MIKSSELFPTGKQGSADGDAGIDEQPVETRMKTQGGNGGVPIEAKGDRHAAQQAPDDGLGLELRKVDPQNEGGNQLDQQVEFHIQQLHQGGFLVELVE